RAAVVSAGSSGGFVHHAVRPAAHLSATGCAAGSHPAWRSGRERGTRMSDVPPDERLGSGLTRRELLERSAAIGAVNSVPGLLGTAVADASTAATPRRGGHLRVGMNDGGAGDTLAPWNIPIYSAAARAEQVYERLFKYDPHAFPRPRLAESVESNRTATIWRLKIRKGVTF